MSKTITKTNQTKLPRILEAARSEIQGHYFGPHHSFWGAAIGGWYAPP